MLSPLGRLTVIFRCSWACLLLSLGRVIGIWFNISSRTLAIPLLRRSTGEIVACETVAGEGEIIAGEGEIVAGEGEIVAGDRE